MPGRAAAPTRLTGPINKLGTTKSDSVLADQPITGPINSSGKEAAVCIATSTTYRGVPDFDFDFFSTASMSLERLCNKLCTGARTKLLGRGLDGLGGLRVEAEDDAARGEGEVDVAGANVGGGRQQEARGHAVLRQRAHRRLNRLQRPRRVRLRAANGSPM